MSTNTINLINPFSVLFAKGVDIEDNTEKLEKELEDVLKALSVKEKEAEQAINVSVSSSKKGGFGKKINPIKDANTEKAMRAMLKEKQQKVEDRERE